MVVIPWATVELDYWHFKEDTGHGVSHFCGSPTLKDGVEPIGHRSPFMTEGKTCSQDVLAECSENALIGLRTLAVPIRPQHFLTSYVEYRELDQDSMV